MTEPTFSATFRLYRNDGLPVTFALTTAAGDPAADARLLFDYLRRLADEGYAVTLPGTIAGETVEEVDGYVLGETKKGDKCAYLYSASHQLQYRIATVYVERFNELPFAVNEKAEPWPGAAPEREMAERRGKLVAVAPFKIVLEETGTNDDGKAIRRFARVHGLPVAEKAGQPPAPRNLPPAVTQSEDWPPADEAHPFYANVLKETPFYGTPDKVRDAMYELELSYPATAPEARAARKQLAEYATKLADAEPEPLFP